MAVGGRLLLYGCGLDDKKKIIGCNLINSIWIEVDQHPLTRHNHLNQKKFFFKATGLQKSLFRFLIHFNNELREQTTHFEIP